VTAAAHASGEAPDGERRDEAARLFERVLRLDPADREGVRPLLSAMRAGGPWSDRERS
jgi:hypothetical protein